MLNSLQAVDASPSLQLDQKPGVVMTETMPGPVPRQLSKKTELETITEKNLATSPSNITSGVPASASASSSGHSTTSSNNGEGRLNVAYGSIGDEHSASSALPRKELANSRLPGDESSSSSESDEDEAGLGSKTPRARVISTETTYEDHSWKSEDEDEKFGAKTPRARFTTATRVSNSDSSGEEMGTKTPKATLHLSRPQASKRKSSHKDKKVESASDEELAPLSDDDLFDNEKALANATDDTDLNAVERDVESRDEDLHIRLMQMPGRRHLTIFEGLGDEYDHKKLLKELKRTFACNGNVKKSKTGHKVVILQGDHCQDLREFLIHEDVPPRKIRMHNF